MSKPSVVVMDTPDDRREIWCLLHRLPPRERFAFVGWCCSRVSGPNGTRPVASALRTRRLVEDALRCDRGDDRLTNALYGDILTLAHQWGLDLAAAARELERRARAPSSGRPSSAS